VADLHVAAILHAPGIDADEAALDLGLQVLGPALNTESVTAAQSQHLALSELFVADRAVAAMLIWQASVHFWLGSRKPFVKLEPQLVLQSILVLVHEPFLHAVRVPLVVLRDNDQRVQVQRVELFQLLNSHHDLLAYHFTAHGLVTLLICSGQ